MSSLIKKILSEARKSGGRREQSKVKINRGALAKARALLALQKKQNFKKKNAKKKRLKGKDVTRVKVDKKKREVEKRAKGERRKGSQTGSHHPFKNRSELGPTKIHQVRPPAPPPKRTRVHRKRNRWSCSKIAAYKQKCVGVASDNKGQTLNINIDRQYKRTYNKAFKRYRTKKRAEARKLGVKADR